MKHIIRFICLTAFAFCLAGLLAGCVDDGKPSGGSDTTAAAETAVTPETEPDTPTDTPTGSNTEPVTEPETEQEDIDMGGDFITGPKSLERLLSEAELSALTVSSTPNDQRLDAMGVEWDPHFFRFFNVDSGCDEAAWELICARLDKLGVQKVRMMILPGWYEPVNDNSDPAVTDTEAFTFDSQDFQSVIRYLDACEAHGIEVNLTVWGVNLGVPQTMDWLAYPTCGDWISAPTDHAEFAENVSALMNYVLKVKGYTCVKELTLYNEPDWAYKGENSVVSFEDYEAMCRAVDARLRADGLRDGIKLILGDDTDTSGSRTVDGNGWFAKCLTHLTDIADGFDTHNYAFNGDTKYRNMEAWAQARNRYFQQKAAGLQYTHNEFGSNRQQGAYYQTDIDDYERGVFLSQMAEATLNGGSAGMLYWVLHDVNYNNYGDIESARMRLGLFTYADNDWQVRPIYHAWGLIMKYTVPGSEVFAVKADGEISATTLRSPDRAWTYLVTNATDAPRVVKLTNPHAGGEPLSLCVHLYAEESLPLGDELIPSAGVAYTKDGETYVYLPAHSFAVLTEVGE